jgi:thiamine-monophosphate kinase
MEYAKELYLGIKEAGEKFDCPIIGGETGAWDGKLAVTITIFGRSAGIAPVTRSGAQPGDWICVTGELGGSMRGRHMEFEPLVLQGRGAAALGAVNAMIDLSDGLSRDILHICQQSDVGALLYADAIPIHPDAIEMRRDGHSPLEHALHDGEDYELLIIVARAAGEATGIRIGEITAEAGVWLVHPDGRREPLEPKGWEHTF